MAELRLALLGTSQLILKGTDVNGRLRPKSRAVVYYLACTGQTQSRSKVGGLLWGDKSENDARNNLRGAITQIRKRLNDHICGDRHTVTFNREAEYWLDVEIFEYTLERAQKVEGAAQRALLRDAVKLYRGDFLEGLDVGDEPIYEEWILPQRARFRQMYSDALEQLITICIDQADYEAGIQYAQQLLHLDDWREDVHRQIMSLYARIGQRTLALKQYEICHAVQLREFNSEPSEVTQALYQQIWAMEEGQPSQPLAPLLPDTEAPPFLAPNRVPHFTGRVDQLEKLGNKLTQAGTRRVIALVGMGGIGKSAMIIELAHALRGVFPDGVLWANAATDDPKAVAERWANAYGFDFSRIPELDERAAVLRDLLQNKQLLIIFDDVTNSAWVRSFIPDSDQCAVLLTMRSASLARVFRAQVMTVMGLSPEDGRSLLAEILTEERVVVEEEMAVQIYQLLQGFPLALSLAAQRLAALPQRKLSWLFERLQVGLAEHGQAVKASFEISWEGLDESHRRIFACLAVFAGRDFPVAALAAVTEIERFPAQGRLDMLVILSLLNEEEDGRYRQHALLALFAKDKLGNDDTPFQRMVAYYTGFARDKQADYAALELEWENLSASIAQAQEMALWPAVLDLTGTLQPAWFRRGRYHEARRAFPKAVAAAKALDDRQALARCLYHWGYICWEQNDWDEADAKLAASLTLFEKLEDLAGVAQVQLQLGVLARDRAKLSDAEKFLTSSMKIKEELDDQVGIAETIYEQAHLQYACGNYEFSQQLYEQALVIQEMMGDQLGTLRSLRSLGGVIGILDPYDLALKKQYIQRAFDLANEFQDQVEIAVIFRHMFKLFWREERYQEAEEFAFKSLNSHRKLGDRRGQSMVYYLLSEFYQQQKSYKTALKYGQNSLEICRALEDIPGMAFSLQRLGNVYNCLGQTEPTCKSWYEALQFAKQMKHEKLIQDLTERLQDC